MSRRLAIGVVTVLLAAAGCSGDDAEGAEPPATDPPSTTTSTSTSTTTTTTTSTTTTTTIVSRPEETPFDTIADLVGITDLEPDHWAQSDDAVERFQVRVVGTDFAIVGDFPVTMNGCDRRQLRVEWRSLADPISVGYTTYLPAGMALELEGEAPSSTRGDMVLNGCEQPAFASSADGLIADLVVEVAIFYPTVGT